jgi:CRISPR-associated endonuclease/helicase Cas3
MAHHGGLRGPSEVDAKLSEEKISSRVALALELATAELPELAQESQVIVAPEHATRDALSHEFFLRMLFSCLVDADFLDTEAHFDDQKSMRRESTFDAAALLTRLREHQERIAKDRDGALTLVSGLASA